MSSSKRNGDLRDNQTAEIEHLIELSELETAKCASPIGTLQSPSDTRLRSHFDSICSPINLFKPTFSLLKYIAIAKGYGTSPSGHAKAAGCVKLMMAFEFLFIMHVMKELTGITNLFCKKLEHKSLDIVNAIDDIITTKMLIQNLRYHARLE